MELRYTVRLCAFGSDDGKPLDSKLVFEGRRTGHFGLPGMRERARSIGGHFELWSEIRQGTEIEVTVPGAIAYRPFHRAANPPVAEQNVPVQKEDEQ